MPHNRHQRRAGWSAPSPTGPPQREDVVRGTLVLGLGRSLESTILLNDQASRANILAELERVATTADENDQVIVYYAGHGVTQDNVGYLMPVDGDPTDLSGSGVSMMQVGKLFSSLKAKQKLLLVDACYAGAFDILSRGVMSIDSFETLLVGEGAVVITAGTESQAVADNTEVGHGLFTLNIVDGMMGSADANGDRLVTVTELFAHVRRRLIEATRRTGFEQTPAMHARGLTDFVVSVIPDQPFVPDVTSPMLMRLLSGREMGGFSMGTDANKTKR